MARRCPPQAPSKTKDRFHLVSDAPAAWVVAAPAPRAGAAAGAQRPGSDLEP
jgi:hypothetical protein